MSKSRFADASVALVVVLTIGLMIVPLPLPFFDALLVANLAFSILLVLVATFVREPISLASFPTLLLLGTLCRLSLNISSTRLILSLGEAGRVISAFGHFVVGGNYVVGAIVFVLLTVIQLVVVARGAERVAEVGARFTLDAMPGKQLAIDADLRAGSLTAADAVHRRSELARESQFYGAMDGAMKFVRGDAVAGLLIVGANLIGGIAIGVGMRGLALADTIRHYGLLTIGDGLVTQIPSLLVSIAAGLVVTRVASAERDTLLGSEIANQILSDPRPLAALAFFLLIIAFAPGLPAAPFLILAAAAAALSYRARAWSRSADGAGDSPLRVEIASAPDDAGWRSWMRGSDRRESRLRAELEALSRELGDELGVEFPAIALARSERVDSERVGALFIGSIRHHSFRARNEAEFFTRFRRALRRHAADLLDYEATQRLVSRLERTHPTLVRHTIPRPISLMVLTQILRRLLAEEVSIRSLDTIVETLLLNADESSVDRLVQVVRVALSPSFAKTYAPDGVIRALLVDPLIEETVRDALRPAATGQRPALAPSVARDVLGALRRSIDGLERPIVITKRDIRAAIRALAEPEFPDLVVLSDQELPATLKIERVGVVTP